MPGLWRYHEESEDRRRDSSYQHKDRQETSEIYSPINETRAGVIYSLKAINRPMHNNTLHLQIQNLQLPTNFPCRRLQCIVMHIDGFEGINNSSSRFIYW